MQISLQETQGFGVPFPYVGVVSTENKKTTFGGYYPYLYQSTHAILVNYYRKPPGEDLLRKENDNGIHITKTM